MLSRYPDATARQVSYHQRPPYWRDRWGIPRGWHRTPSRLVLAWASRPAFVVAALFFVVGESCLTVRELHRGRLSTGIIILDFMPGLLLLTGISLFLSSLAARLFGSDWGGIVLFLGIEVTVLGFLGAAMSASKTAISKRT